MANLTVQQLIDLAKNDVGQLDSQKLDTGILILKADFSQREVWKDLMPQLGMKHFTKYATLTGNNPAEPSDLSEDLNAVIDVKAGVATGTKASYTVHYTTPTASITYTAVTSGTDGNNIHISLDGTDPGSGVQIICSHETYWTITINPHAGLTCKDICDAVNADVAASLLILATTTTPTVVPIPSTGTATTLSEGTDGTIIYYPCKEWTIEEENQLQNDSYKAPSATQPKYIRRGDANGTNKLKFYPSTINSSVMYYRYKLPELTAVSDSLTIPTTYEPLLYKKFLGEIYGTLKAQAESADAKADYELKKKNLFDTYQAELGTFVQEKQRLQSNNIQK